MYTYTCVYSIQGSFTTNNKQLCKFIYDLVIYVV